MPSPWTTLAAAIVVAVGVGLAGGRHVEAPPLAAGLFAAGALGRTAVVVLQPADCASRLEALAPLVTEAGRAGTRVVVRVPGGAASTESVRAQLVAMGWSLDVASASATGVRALRGLGHRASPVVIVFDEAGRVAHVRPLPVTPDDLVQWHRLVPLVVRG